MTSLSNKPLFNQFISSLVFFLLIVVILDFVCSSTASVSSITSPFVYTNNKIKVAEERKEARALLKWKNNLHSKSQSFLSSWAGSNPCNWVGIYCDKSGSITQLNLSSHSLKGTLHNLSFQSFPNLLSVDLSYNSLFGTIPSNIAHLSKLSVLNLSYNQFTGRIPFEIGRLTSLHIFDLADNRMSGLIPQELGGLTSLSEFDLSSNNLIGTIPASLGNLSNLTTLYLHANQLSGSIPQELGMLSSLNDLRLSFNSLTGTIPASLGNLRNLTTLYLGKNQLSGFIPHELGMLSSLTDLELSINSLTGTIPASLGNLSNLTTLYLYENQLSGSIPRELGMLSSLIDLGLSFNNLTSVIPASFGNLSKLSDLNLGSNKLSGSFPQEFGMNNFTQLKMFEISNNLFTAHVSDFGTSKIMSSDTSYWTSFAGTIGYAAPENAYTMEVSEKCDVYSFGVVTLEVIMGRHPGDLISSFLSSSSHDVLLEDVLDQRLVLPTRQVAEKVVLVAKIALACLHNNPQSPANIFSYFNVNLDLYKPNEADFFLFLQLLHFCGPKALKVQETKLVKVNQNISSNLSGSSSLALHICIRLSNSRALFLLKRPHLLLQQPTGIFTLASNRRKNFLFQSAGNESICKEIFIHGNDMEEAQMVRPRKQSMHIQWKSQGEGNIFGQGQSEHWLQTYHGIFTLASLFLTTQLIDRTGIKTGLPLSLFYSPKDAKSSNGGKRFNCGGMGSIEILLRPR
ncbi:hypothetical protein CMV_010919 [Castanea mollissima]|nr:hypothetical protein CMV_010919 [Castanea mollissima]